MDRLEITELALISKDYFDRQLSIRKAVVECVMNGQSRRAVATRFGMTKSMVDRMVWKDEKAMAMGRKHRTGLNNIRETVALIEADIAQGHFPKHSILPPGKKLIQTYNCNMKTLIEARRMMVKRSTLNFSGGRFYIP